MGWFAFEGDLGGGGGGRRILYCVMVYVRGLSRGAEYVDCVRLRVMIKPFFFKISRGLIWRLVTVIGA